MRFSKTFTTIATTTALVGLSSLSAHAASFDNTGLSFDTDTIVDFEFLESHGSYSSDFGIVEIDQDGNVIDGTQTILLYENDRGYDLPEVDDFLGTAGNTVIDPMATFFFEAGKTYSFFLDSYNTGIDMVNGGFRRFDQESLVYSTNSFNPDLGYGNQQAEFSGNVFGDGAILAWDDTGNNLDGDFNDFYVHATAEPVDVPEPTALLSLGLVGGLITMSRRRNRQQS